MDLFSLKIGQYSYGTQKTSLLETKKVSEEIFALITLNTFAGVQIPKRLLFTKQLRTQWKCTS